MRPRIIALCAIASVATACGGSSGGGGVTKTTDGVPELNQDRGNGQGWVDYGADCPSGGNCLRQLHVFGHDCILATYDGGGAGLWCDPSPQEPSPSPSPTDVFP